MSHRQPLLGGIAVLTVVDSVAAAAEAVAAGAAVVDAGMDEALVADIRHADLDVLICGPGTVAHLSRYDLPDALRAVQQGVSRERILIQVSPDMIKTVTADGWRCLVDVDEDEAPGTPGTDTDTPGAGTPGSAREAIARAGAIATVCAWLGVTVVATKHVREIRRCLDMTESIRGTRPPAWAVRGLG